MNLQPLEYFEAIYACGLKLLHRNYAGPLLQAARHNDGTEVLVYPDINGSVSLDSPIELLSGNSQSVYLGEFLCVGSYTADAALGLPTPNVTAGVVTLFDQSVNINNLTNTDTATQPLLCDNGDVFFTDWGLGLSFSGGRYYETNAIEQSFTLHMRMQFLNAVGSRYLFRQTDNAVYAKVTDTYLDEAVGTDSTVVFLNESYFRDYTTYDIQLPIEEAALITLEVSVSDNVFTSPPVYRIEGADLVHSLVVYSGVDEHVRRHVTNKVLAEDVPALAEKLNRFNPQSYYNLVAGAKAMFGTFSFAGVLGQQNTRIMRLKRQVGVVVSYIDLLVDNTGYITLDSPVENPSDDSLANVLGEWVAHPDYVNSDGIAGVDALVNRLYSQINDANYAYAVGFSEPKLYDSLSQTLVSAGLNGVVGLEFYVPSDSNPNKGLILNEPIYAKTVVVVYANKTANYEMNTLLSTGYGAEIYSKFSGAEANVPQLGEHGVTMYDQTDFSFTDDGLDINVHVVSLYDDNQKLIVDTTEYPITYDSVPDGIEGTPLEPDARWEFIGASSDTGSYPHKGRICAVIYYDDDKYDQREFIHNYMNTLFGIQNLPISDSTLIEPEIQSTLLTDYPGAAAAYSLRKVNPEYTGPCIRVRRASDNVEIDVRFNSLYEVNQSALNIFCNGTDGFVTRWYDQSSEGNDATQTTTGSQPKIYDASTGVELNVDNSLPGLLSDTATFLSFSKLTTIRSVFVAGRTTATSSKQNFILGDNTNYDYHSGNSANLWLDPSVTTNSDVVNGDNYLDGVLTNFGTTARTVGTHLISLFHLSSTGTASRITSDRFGTRSWEGHLQELIIYTSDQSANREGIESEINGHYGIYDSGLLADYPGAAAAYSLRQLNTGYTGPAVRVRRASDNTELNVYFDSSGALDTAAIESHCSGTDGFVSAWFDQSSEGNDATQGTTSAQPKIYDAATGVLLDNLKPTFTTGSGQGLNFTPISLTNFSVFAVIYAPPNASLVYGNSGTTRLIFQNLETALIYSTTSNGAYTGTSKNAQALLSAHRDNGVSESVYQDGSALPQTTQGGAGAIELDSIMMVRPGDKDRKYQELIIYPSDQSANRAGIEANLNDHYSIY